VTNHSYLDVLERNSATVALWCMVSARWNAPMFRKQCPALLNGTSRNKRIGRDQFLVWPTRSPDNTPLEFFYKGYVKNIMYQGGKKYRSSNSATSHKLRFWTRGTRSNIVSTCVQLILETATELWDHLCCVINYFSHRSRKFCITFLSTPKSSKCPFLF
jgi:hypothetical protein